MLLNELFDNATDYSKVSPYVYAFTVDKINYTVDFREEILPKEAREKLNRTANGIEIAFSIQTNDEHGKDFKFGITNTGNSITVFATVVTIIEEFIQTEKPEFFFFAAEEPSRRKLYDRLSKVLIRKTNYNLFHTLVNNYGKNYIFQSK